MVAAPAAVREKMLTLVPPRIVALNALRDKVNSLCREIPRHKKSLGEIRKYPKGQC